MKMHRIAVSAFMGLVALASASNVSAADVIDQNSSANTSFLGALSLPGLAQSFVQAGTNISGAGVWLDSAVENQFPKSLVGYLTIELWDELPTSDTDTGYLRTKTVDVSSSEAKWVDVFWDEGYDITSADDSTFYLVFSGSSTLTTTGFGFDESPSPYASGIAFSGTTFERFPSYDYAFRTYAFENTAPIPEPETYAMMLAGLGLLGLARRRKQKAA